MVPEGFLFHHCGLLQLLPVKNSAKRTQLVFGTESQCSHLLLRYREEVLKPYIAQIVI